MTWQTMETAPKDGTDVLVFDHGDFFVAWWSTSIWVSPGAWIYCENRSDTCALNPEFWQPLPDYPVAFDPPMRIPAHADEHDLPEGAITKVDGK